MYSVCNVDYVLFRRSADTAVRMRMPALPQAVADVNRNGGVRITRAGKEVPFPGLFDDTAGDTCTSSPQRGRLIGIVVSSSMDHQ